MSSSSPQGESRYGQPQRPPVSSDELLPPIEPPSAGFIIQLFVIPAVIVAAVVLIWFGVESLARSGQQDPQQIVAGLRSSNQARFQQAKELADMLRLPERYPEIKTNRELAQKLAAYLDELVEESSDAEAEVTMRIFIVKALGEFHVADGLPALIDAALDDPERDVRRDAIGAIAVLLDGMAGLKPPQHLGDEELTAAVVELANDQDELIRSGAAFALGVAASAPNADPQLLSALEALADDPYTDVRFNAAMGLARVGSPSAVEALSEMLDPESIASSVSGERAMNEQMSEEALRAQKAFKRNTIISNALTSIDRLLSDKELPADATQRLIRELADFVGVAPKIDDPTPLPDELIDKAYRTLNKAKRAYSDKT
jgi:HEAT repeat protein